MYIACCAPTELSSSTTAVVTSASPLYKCCNLQIKFYIHRWTTAIVYVFAITILLLRRVAGARCCNERVCMSVCPLAYLGNHTSKHEIFYTCYPGPWLDHLLTTVEYVMYFRFCWWRHFAALFFIIGPMARSIGNIYVSAVLGQVVINFQRIRRRAPHCLTLSSYTVATNCAAWTLATTTCRALPLGGGMQHGV